MNRLEPVETTTAKIVGEDLLIASDTPGIELYLRNKRRYDLAHVTGERTVLFVHGSTYPASASFDLPLDGISFMDHLAQQGYDVYLLDIRGYGRSSRPAERDQPAAANPPLVRTQTAVRDVGSAVAFIRARRAIEKVNLIGWSWGTTLTGSYTVAHNENVNKLVLLAPQWLRTTPSLSDPGGEIGAYRLVSRDDAKARWLKGVAEHKRSILPDAWFEARAASAFASDPWGMKQDPPALRAPNGTVQDSRDHWAAGKPLYDPGEIKVPVLLVHAEWDQDLPLDMCRTYFSLLTGAPYRRWVEVGEGTHSLFLERNRWQVFDAVSAFLAEAGSGRSTAS
jgi:pimeloyl-ACP methyl ester carboxylesterase